MDSRPTTTPSQIGPAAGEDSLPGISAAITRINRSIKEFAQEPGLVFLTGDRGTEKSLAAKLLHHHSPRANRPLGKLRVSWKLPPELIQHVQQCANGTLVLVLQRELPIDMQYTLVEIASHGIFVDPLSGATVDCPNIGIVLLTSQTLEELAGARTGTVLPELKELLEARQIKVPPLRARPEDIPAIVRYAIARAKETGRCNVSAADAQVLALFRHWHWPGNAEDLLLVTAQAALAAEGEMISLKDLPEEFTSQLPPEEIENAKAVRMPRPVKRASRRSHDMNEVSSVSISEESFRTPIDSSAMETHSTLETPMPFTAEVTTRFSTDETPLDTRDRPYDPHTEVTPIPAETTLPLLPHLIGGEPAPLPRRLLTLARRLGAQSQILSEQIASVRATTRSSEGVPKLPSNPPPSEDVPAYLVEEELNRGLDLVLALRRQLTLLNQRQRESIDTFRDLVSRLKLASTPDAIDASEIEAEKVELARQLESIRAIIERVGISIPGVTEGLSIDDAQAEIERMEAMRESTDKSIRLSEQ
jgi:hypothetical protein